jgi:putative sporulation protein YtxC
MRWVQFSFPWADERFLPLFRQALHQELTKASSVLHFRIQEERDESYCYFYCQGWPKEEHTWLVHEEWLSALARTVRVYIARKEEEFIYRRVLHHPYYEEVEKKHELLQYVFEYTREKEEREEELYYKHWIEQEAVIYLESEHVLHLDGFFRFRLQKYFRQLAMMVDLSVEQYIAEEEQEEFIRKLRSCIRSLPGKMSLLRIVHTSELSLTYYNEAWEELTFPFSTHDYVQVESMYMGEEIELIEALVGFAPARIVVYTEQPEHYIIDVLQRIFAENLSICTDFTIPLHLSYDP